VDIECLGGCALRAALHANGALDAWHSNFRSGKAPEEARSRSQCGASTGGLRNGVFQDDVALAIPPEAQLFRPGRSLSLPIAILALMMSAALLGDPPQAAER